MDEPVAASVRGALRISRRIATDKNQSNRKRRANDHDVNPRVRFSASLPGKIDVFRALQSLRSQFKRPRDHERDRKPNHNCEHDQSHRPVWNFEERKNLCSNLN